MNQAGILIIGASAGGISAAREIRRHNATVPVTILSREPHMPYYRPMLTEYIADESVKGKTSFYLNPETWYAQNRISLRLGEEAVAIDTADHTVATSKGDTLPYAKLILANGSSPFVPIQGVLDKRNVFAVRTLDDAHAVYECAGKSSRAAVIGGGLLGLEAAYSLSRRGLKVSIIEVSGRILPRQLDTDCSAILERIIARSNIELLKGRSVASIAGDETASAVVFEGGEFIETDMVVFSIGVRPNSRLAGESGIQVGKGVIVNDRMETSAADVYACGDVAEFRGTVIALWMTAVAQGKTAGANAAGKDERYDAEIYPALLNSFGTRIISAGDICLDRNENEYRIHFASDTARDHHKKLFFVDNKLVGYILIGDVSESQKLTAAIRRGASYDEIAR